MCIRDRFGIDFQSLDKTGGGLVGGSQALVAFPHKVKDLGLFSKRRESELFQNREGLEGPAPRQTLSGLQEKIFPPARLVPMHDDGPQAFLQGLDSKGFEEIAVHFALSRSGDNVLGDFPGYHKNGGGLVLGGGSQAPQEVEAIHAGHVDVADHEVIGLLLEGLPGFLAVRGFLDGPLYSQMYEHLAEHAADGGHIVHYQDI